jgi:hypothetical protein
VKYRKLSSIIWPAIKSLKRKPGAKAIDYKESVTENRREGFDTEISVYRDFFDYSHQTTPAAWFYIPAQQAQLSLLLSDSFPLPVQDSFMLKTKL